MCTVNIVWPNVFEFTVFTGTYMYVFGQSYVLLFCNTCRHMGIEFAVCHLFMLFQKRSTSVL